MTGVVAAQLGSPSVSTVYCGNRATEGGIMLRAVLLALVCVCGPRAFACENPPMVAIPEGASSTRDELLQAQEAVKAYLAAMQTYLICVQEEQTAAGENSPTEYKALMVKRQQTAVDEMETVAALFNEQIRAYREVNPEPPISQPGNQLQPRAGAPAGAVP